MDRKRRILISSLLIALLAGITIVLAYFTSTDSANNFFKLGNKYTLTYHANAGSDDSKVTNVPSEQSQFGSGTDPVTFDVAADKPVRPGYVFTGWYEKETPTSSDQKYGDGGAAQYTAPADQKDSHLYAQWTAGYTLIYDANRAEGAKGGDAPAAATKVSDADSESFDIAAKGNLSWIITIGEGEDASETDEYKVFLGWSEDKNATSPTYTDTGKWAYTGDDFDGDNSGDTAKTITITSQDPDRTKTLYAVWATKYELKYALHPELNDPPSKEPVPKTQTCVSTAKKYTFTIPERIETGADANAPTRDGGYEWGWWGDSLDRFGYIEGGTNEGCYLFGEPFINHHTEDSPTWTLYAYFQPPAGVWVHYYNNAYQLNEDFTPNTREPKMTDPTNVSGMPRSPVGTVATDLVIPVDITTVEPTHPKYEFLGWSKNPNATEPDVFEGNKINLDKRKSNIARLYAVWQHKHKFRVAFYNTPSDSYTQTNYYINKNNGNKWTSTTYNNANCWFEKNGVLRTAPAQDEWYLDESYTFDQDYFNNLGLFATRADDKYGSYKFLGWSYTPYPTRGEGQYDKNNPEHRIEFPVDAPENANELNNTVADPDNDKGKIKGSIKAEESDPPCTAPQIHEVKLYAVWERSPLHNFSLTFARNDSTETLSRGSASAASYTCTYPNDYTNPRRTTVRALDEPTYTWTAESWTGASAATTCPTVTKKETDTATYEFIGWSTEKNKTKESDVDYAIDETTKLLSVPVKLGDETDADAKDCEAGTHSITLYPVFKPVPRHKYAVYFDVNQPTALNLKGIEMKLYRKKSDGSWNINTRDKDTLRWDDSNNIKSYGNKTDIEGVSRTTSNGTIEYTEIKDLDTKSLSWPDEYTSYDPAPTMGIFATCENKNATSSTEYKFIGWSYTKYTLTGNTRYIPGESTLEFPVSAPADPSDIQDGEGMLDNPVVIDIDEKNPDSEYACDKDADAGRVHNRVLYGVWTGEVLHQYSVTFDGNGAGSKVKYGSLNDWQNGTTKDDSNASDGKCVNYSDARKPAKESAEDDDKYTFDAAYWTDKNVIAKAERAPGDGFEYTFAGWSLKPDTDPSDTDNIITVNSDGYITQDIIAECDKYPCDGSEVHDVKLYAVWNKRAVHRYSVIFYNDGTSGSVQSKSGSNWSNASTTVGKSAVDARDLNLTADLRNTYRVFSNYIYLDTGFPAVKHSWDANTLAVRAVKKSTDNIEYTFVGWATEPVQPSIEWTRNSDIIALHINDDGFITDEIELNEPDTVDTCQYDTHNRIYYPVFRMDPIHKFTIQFNYNSGNGIRYRSGNSWNYTTSSTRSYSQGPVKLSESGPSYTWYKEDNGPNTGFWDKEGIGAYKNTDAFYSYEFVGWSKTKQETPIDSEPSDTIRWKDDPDSNLAGAGYIDEDITVNCPDPCEGGTHPTVIYYAVWNATPLTKTYNLKFNGNDSDNPNISDVPEDIMEKTETYDDGGTYKGGTWKGYDFDMPDVVPKNKKRVFTGWSTDPNATQGEFGHPNTQNPQIAELTGGLEDPYHMATAPSAYEATKTETMYAIWWYEFYLEYNANEGGSQAPPLARAYKSADSYSFPLDKNIPVHKDGLKFLGWATSPNATTPEYQPGDYAPLTACTDPSSDDYGYVELKLYAVWGSN